MALRKLTLAEIDGILQRASARQLHAELHIPDADNILFKKDQVQLSLGHLSDKRDGTHVRESRYDSVNLKEAYPIIAEAGSVTTTTINKHILTAGVPTADMTISANRINRVQFMRAASSAFAANRQLDVMIWDGTDRIYIFRSGAGALLGASDGLIFPTDELLATYPGSRNSFDIHSGSYLRFNATGLAAAETITIYTHMIAKDAGGLRQ